MFSGFIFPLFISFPPLSFASLQPCGRAAARLFVALAPFLWISSAVSTLRGNEGACHANFCKHHKKAPVKSEVTVLQCDCISLPLSPMCFGLQPLT